MNTNIETILKEIDHLKAKLDKVRPLPADAVKKIKEALEMEYTYESNRIEGNTLTLQETALVVNEGITIGGKSMKEHLEAINHAQAVEFIKDIATKDIATKDIAIDERTIKEIHALILHGINRDDAGKYRNVPVMIVGSRHTPPQPYLIEPQMEQFMRDFEQMKKDSHPVIVSAYLHDELVKIHPFIDGNGRTSRLLMNLYLLSNGYPIATLKGDNDAKQAYYRALEISHTEGNRDEFYLLVAKTVKTALETYLKIVADE